MQVGHLDILTVQRLRFLVRFLREEQVGTALLALGNLAMVEQMVFVAVHLIMGQKAVGLLSGDCWLAVPEGLHRYMSDCPFDIDHNEADSHHT